MRSIESGVRADFDDLLNGFVTGIGNSNIINGFEISMTGAINSSSSALQVIVAEGTVFHGKSNEAGTFLVVPKLTPNETLSSTTNTKVSGSFTSSALNYIGIEFTRAIDNSTTSQVYFWNPTSASEFTKTVPLAETLNYKFVITTSVFASNVLPLAIVETDGANNVLRIEDRRPMLFRLGSSGTNTPDPSYVYPWNNHVEGRVENTNSSDSSAISPFRGGDKQIKNLKEWMDAVMSALKEIKGTTYWYSSNIGGSIVKLRSDLANLMMTGKGNVSHDNLVSGKINWSEDIFLNTIGSRVSYKILANASSSNITLADDKVAYINFRRGASIIPNLIFTQGSNEVSSIANVSWTTDLQENDYIKDASQGDDKYYKISSIFSSSKVILTETFAEVSTGTLVGIPAQYAWGTYESISTPTTDRHIKIASRKVVPLTEDIYWLFLREDNGGSTPKVYVRGFGEIQKGETREISDNSTEQTIEYIGAASETSSTPDFVVIATDAKTGQSNYNTINENLTIRAAKLTSMMADKAQDKTIKYADNFVGFVNSTNALNQEISFLSASSAPIPVLNIITPSSSNFNNSITATGTLSLLKNQVAYFKIDRNAAFSFNGLNTLTVVDLASLPLEENIFVFAYRLTGTEVYLWDNKKLKLGSNAVSVNYEEIITVVSGTPFDTHEITGPYTAEDDITLPLDQEYVVGSKSLKITLNGLKQLIEIDYFEIGAANTLSKTIQMIDELQIDDVLSITII